MGFSSCDGPMIDHRLGERSEEQCDLWVINFPWGDPSKNLPRVPKCPRSVHRGSPERPRLGFHRLALGAFFATPAVADLDLCHLDQKHWRGFGDAVAPFYPGWWKILIWWTWKLQIDCFPSNWTAGFKGKLLVKISVGGFPDILCFILQHADDKMI